MRRSRKKLQIADTILAPLKRPGSCSTIPGNTSTRHLFMRSRRHVRMLIEFSACTRRQKPFSRERSGTEFKHYIGIDFLLTPFATFVKTGSFWPETFCFSSFSTSQCVSFGKPVGNSSRFFRAKAPATVSGWPV